MMYDANVCECGHYKGFHEDPNHGSFCEHRDLTFETYRDIDGVLRQRERPIYCQCKQFASIEAPQKRLV